MAADSLSLTDDDIRSIRQDHEPFRLISVDGGHTREHVVRDLLTAVQLAHVEGLILIDDWFHPGFPGVTEGYFDLARSAQLPFVPIFVHLKKLVLCHVSMRPRFAEMLRANPDGVLNPFGRPKLVRFAGHDAFFYNV